MTTREPPDSLIPPADPAGVESSLAHRASVYGTTPSGSAPDHASRARRHLWIFVAFAAIAGFFLLTEHQAHALGLLPYLLLIACPLMHLLMHRNHGRHGPHGGRQ